MSRTPSEPLPPIARPRFAIAIDGPAASGKSSTARMVAEALGFRHVDSGAFYRAATCARLRQAGSDANPWTAQSVLDAARDVELHFAGLATVPVLGGRPLEAELRDGEVTRRVSEVARMQAVRMWVNTAVRRAAEGESVVVDGRDIGTAVFPQADLKIYLVADPWERARRRLLQRLGRAPTEAQIAEETDRLVHRDALDANQSVQANDAIVIDTTPLTQAEQVERIVLLARAVNRRPGDTSPVDAPVE